MSRILTTLTALLLTPLAAQRGADTKPATSSQLKKRVALMHTPLARNLGVISLIAALFFTQAQAAPPTSAFGVWSRGGGDADVKESPFVRGAAAGGTWAEMEKKPGAYDWSKMDQAVERAQMESNFLFLSFEVGPDSPGWIYEKGVPKVVTDDTLHQGKFPFYPYYLAPQYKLYFRRFITEAAKHIRSYPVEKRKRIAFIQVKTGCTGDETPYKGVARYKKYNLPKSSKAWDDFRIETFALYAKLFDQVGPKITLLFNGIGEKGVDEEGEGKQKEVGNNGAGSNAAANWVKNNISGGYGTKGGALARGHHLAEERSLYNNDHQKYIDPKGVPCFAICEMDQTWTRPLYQRNVPLGFYWGAINALNYGLSIWDVTKGAMQACREQGFDYSFYFFNKYAGQIYPATATDAFCALHKGLDASDTVAYPEARYGKAGHKNVERMEQIVADYAKYGAAIEDKKALTLGQVGQRGNQAGYNDVGRDIWPDNYGRFLYQIDADATSSPLWRIGGPITPTSSIYSRFARGFEHASGKDAMYFKLHDGFSQGNEPKVMSITVVWYDGQAGSSWKLDYDAGTPTMKTAQIVTGKGDKQWHHEAVTLRDAVFRHGGTKGSDLALVNTDAKDDIFSLIEVHRGEPEFPALRPPTEYRVVPNSKGAKFGKGDKGDKKKDKKQKDPAAEEK